MLPFIEVFGREVPMYAIMMLTGAFLAIFFACLGAKRRRVERLDVLLASLFAFLVGLLGAKLLFIITDIPSMIKHFSHDGFSFKSLLSRMANAGIVFYGGLIGGFAGGYMYLRVFRLDFWKHADAMIPFLPLAHAFGRLGCFCAGCCYGRPMDPPWGMYFNDAIGAPHNVALLPVQLYEAMYLLLILFPCIQVYSRKECKPGQVVGLYFVLYGIFRFCNEYLRYDEIRGIFLGVSTSQWISIILVPIGLLLLSGKISGLLKSRYIYHEEYEPCDLSECEQCPEKDDCSDYHKALAELEGSDSTATEESDQAASDDAVDKINNQPSEDAE